MTLIGFTMVCEQAGRKQLVRDVALARTHPSRHAQYLASGCPGMGSDALRIIPRSGRTGPDTHVSAGQWARALIETGRRPPDIPCSPFRSDRAYLLERDPPDTPSGS